MKKNYKLIIEYIIVSTILVLIVLGVIGLIKFIKEKNKIVPPKPEIIVDEVITYSKEFITLSSGRLYLNKDNYLIEQQDNKDMYYFGEYGKVYPNKKPIGTIYEEDNLIDIVKNYKIYKKSKNYYYVNTNTNKTSSKYKDIKPISCSYNENNIIDDNTCKYIVLLTKTNVYKIINVETNKVITLKSGISISKENNEYQVTSESFIVKKKKKYGLYNYSGKVVIKIDNDSIKILDNDKLLLFKNNSYRIINNLGKPVINRTYKDIRYTKNGNYVVKSYKKYGIVDEKNKTLVSSKYDHIREVKNHTIVVLNNKLGILNEKYKTLINAKIELDGSYNNCYSNDEKNCSYSVIEKDNYLYLFTYGKDENNHTYYINKAGLAKTINMILEPIYDYNEEINYFYKLNQDGDILHIDLYKSNLFKFYSYDIKLRDTSDFKINIRGNDNSYYEIKISYPTISESETYYFDLKKSKEVSELTALRKYLPNGVSYTIKDNVLNLYSYDELLGSIDNIKSYIGEYMFVEDGVTDRICRINFKKEIIK